MSIHLASIFFVTSQVSYMSLNAFSVVQEESVSSR